MIYHKFKDLSLSALGMGCMRLPRTESGEIDTDKTCRMIDYAIANGVNYFDTAWVYHGGASETEIGKALSRHPRDSFYLATKYPGFHPENLPDVKETFEAQLSKCRVDYFDFYLFHNVCERNVDAYLDPKIGIFDYLIAQKRAGRIRHLGFSTHGSLETMERFLRAYGEDLEFCQIQLNYLDWTYQNAKEKVELLKKYNVPVWVMEPVRGGRLAKLPKAAEATLRALRPDESMPGWAFRFLQSVPEIRMILSGMSNEEQLRQNIETFSEDKPLTGAEKDALLGVAEKLIAADPIPCTACRYCTDGCPQGLEIPDLLSMFNEFRYDAETSGAKEQIGAMPKEKRPSACIGCRACEGVCPQHIPVADHLAAFAEKLAD